MKRIPDRFGDVVRSLSWFSIGIAAFFSLGCGDMDPASRLEKARPGVDVPQARLRVRVEPARQARLASAERVTGTVRAFHRSTVTAETQGRVVARHVEAGTHVEEGGLLVELESSRLELELRRAEAALRAAQTVLTHAQREFERGKQLLERNAISTQHFDDLQHGVDRARDEVALATVARDTARRNLADTKIKAPFAGMVDSLAVDVGDFVTSGTPVATLVDLSRVRIFGGVTAREAARLESGTPARVSFADLGGASFDATLMSVGRVASNADGTYEIELWLDPPEDVTMRDGLVAQIALPDFGEAPTLLVHRAAVLRRDGRPEVFVVREENGMPVARIRHVRTGRSQGDWIEILDGLEEGDAVVWDGHFALEDGSVVVVDGSPENLAVVGVPVAAPSD